MEKQGKLLIIGFGPGALEQITGRALAAIEESEAVIGYNTYVELIRPLLTNQEIVGTGMTEEVSRAREAVRRAEAGQTIAVISSGDAGVYGMAGLVYEVLMERGWSPSSGVQVEVIPGISAIQSCASLLGAPVMHDSCTISLSDHLTPWDSIAGRVEAAGAADFVIAFYNPRSGRRTRQIEEARSILLRYRAPSTPVGIVRNAYRERQEIIITTLQEMPLQEIGMLSTVIVGNSSTTVYEGLMVTPRGYGRKYNLGADAQALKPHERLRPAAEPWSLAAGRSSGSGGSLPGGGAPADAGKEQAAGRAALDCSAAVPAPAGLAVSPELGSRRYSGAQMRLLAELAGDDGQLVYSRDGHFLLYSSQAEQAELAARLSAGGMHVSLPGDTVRVISCDFCELRKDQGRETAVRLHKLLHGQPVPRELHVSVAGCGMACSSAVLEDIGVVYTRGSYELYLGGKKTGRGAHAGTRVRSGMNEDEAVAAVAEVVGQYREHGRPGEKFHAFFADKYGDMSRAEVIEQTGSAARSEEEIRMNKKTILLVGHGSRVEAGNEELRSFTAGLAAGMPELNIETCFIELAAPSIAGGIERCVTGGATTVYVVPVILFAAGHSKLDIPMAIDEARKKYPGVELVYGRPVGVQERAVDILLDRIAEAAAVQGQAETQDAPVPAGDTIVLMMGRGGSDPDANSDFYKLSRLLWERTAYKSVESCFIAIAGPSLDEGLERCLALGARKIIVLPYLLFTGVLMQQFTERVTAFAAAHPEIRVELGSSIGSHPLLAEMLKERIAETLHGRAFANCDNCRYRAEAAAHHHHHHDDGHGHHHGHHHEHEGSHGHGHSSEHHRHEPDHQHDRQPAQSAAQPTDGRQESGTAAAETAAAGSPGEL
ncbi:MULTISPECIES: precorrin-3B C(17)-methyltransferase [unclassified Paenibacillus]|uniref:precorrin-3B C(17)-methyltransferase n=1 Tax=unclassified Paenibacillus TaxID=185978 RepID=UPI0024073EDE|nr:MULTISPECIES: precorrin-3B C(17)-methyltransferase [unclassified Paenibacillus]MDF9844232.1 precorrin-3B C17-methyltransferase [Paenibacillus sp. PastF-2]MDF9850837.1 precorrin-3B C17-methyltransferase [Paenibacillus sp. PastM-2]MDF9857400.1 precorrin-3B C17-methyltransferase [Paenibacillus sp. PastF-1]MDH6482668.1 precorrin-3B C17-methyltransferase [Paenibacillus sp. PastH-2]MDH6510102.1 precorrin-3B C17-methyltransferase [Paenibacillus sp. PastM-3]